MKLVTNLRWSGGEKCDQRPVGRAEDQADEGLEGTLKDDGDEVGVRLEGDAEEDGEAGDGENVVDAGSGDDQGRDALVHSVAPLLWVDYHNTIHQSNTNQSHCQKNRPK